MSLQKYLLTRQNIEDPFKNSDKSQCFALLGHLWGAVVGLVCPRQYRDEHGDGPVAVQQTQDQEHSTDNNASEKWSINGFIFG